MGTQSPLSTLLVADVAPSQGSKFQSLSHYVGVTSIDAEQMATRLIQEKQGQYRKTEKFKFSCIGPVCHYCTLIPINLYLMFQYCVSTYDPVFFSNHNTGKWACIWNRSFIWFNGFG